jgi:hypothetical protein
MNVVVGYVVAVLTQIAIFPMFGLVLSVADNLVIRRNLHGGIAPAQFCAPPAIRRSSCPCRSGIVGF